MHNIKQSLNICFRKGHWISSQKFGHLLFILKQKCYSFALRPKQKTRYENLSKLNLRILEIKKILLLVYK